MLRPAARGHDIEEEVKVGAKKDCWGGHECRDGVCGSLRDCARDIPLVPQPRSNLTSPIQFSCLRGSINQPDVARITDITQRGERKEEIASRMLKSQKFLMSTIIPLGF
jgi:hypothetical protein